MSALESTLVCQGCGYRVPAGEARPFACPRAAAGDGVDHALRRRLRIQPAGRPRLTALFAGGDPNPFLRFRELLHSHAAMTGRGLSDGEFVEVVEALDRDLAADAGRGLRVTPCAEHPDLAAALGCAHVWVKDETENLGGTHKGRHLTGLLLWLLLEGRLSAAVSGDAGEAGGAPREALAISSCGNAALAASIVASSVGWPIEVFVPPDAHPRVVERLGALGATLLVCERRPGEAGDPCYLRFLERLDAGGIPFTCQGPANGLSIEGGQTLVWEMATTLLGAGTGIDRLFVQTGGGALATACIQGWREAGRCTELGRLPAVHAVQTAAVAPLVRAYDRLAARIAARQLEGGEGEGGGGEARREPAGEVSGSERAVNLAARAALARRIRDELPPRARRRELRYAARHRAEFMWPCDGDTASVADAILDDETYDWLPVVSGMLESGGFPIEVDEPRLREANRLAQRATSIGVSHTGSAGLAGALELAAAGLLGAEERLGLLFTGVRW